MLPSRLAGLAVALCLAAPAAAQVAPSIAADAPVERFVPTPAARLLADSLLHEMNFERVLRVGAMATFDAGFGRQPAMAPLRDVMEAWVAKYMSWEELGAPMTELYAESFSEDDLRALLAFYRTPAGRRLAHATPELSRRGSEIGAAVAAKHGAELEARIAERMAELSAPGRPPR